MQGLPWAVSIETNNNCNLHCPECPTGNHGMGTNIGWMTMEKFDQLLLHLPDTVLFVNLYFLGEPLLHPQIFNMVCKLKQRKIYVSLSTNGQLLSHNVAIALIQSGLDRLIISLDGYDQVSYEAYRVGGSFQRVLDALAHINKAKAELSSSQPMVILQTLLLQTTENQLDRIKKLGESLKADKIVFKTAWFDTANINVQLMPLKDENRRYYQDKDARWQVKSGWPDRCFRMWGSAVINWEGKVLPCCFDKEMSHEMGNAIKKPLREIWRGPEYLAFRKRIVRNRRSVPMCLNCTSGLDLTKRS